MADGFGMMGSRCWVYEGYGLVGWSGGNVGCSGGGHLCLLLVRSEAFPGQRDVAMDLPGF